MKFDDAFDIIHAIKYDLQQIFQKEVRLYMLTDRFFLAGVLTRNQSIREKELNLELEFTKVLTTLRKLMPLHLCASDLQSPKPKPE